MVLGVTCVPCLNAYALGWWGPEHEGTHCRDCHRSWSGETQSHCTRCHIHFGSLYAFDRHFVKGACTDLLALRGECKCATFRVRMDPNGPTVVAALHQETCPKYQPHPFQKDVA